MPSVSLAMIVKDEADSLPTCLRSIADLVNEVVVVDTGSSDDTKSVAGSFGASVFDFPWNDSFAAARNESIDRATGDWIFWLDADERLDTEDRGHLRTLFAGLSDDNMAYRMKQVSEVRFPQPIDGRDSVTQVADQVRLFRRRPEIRWQFRVFEQIRPAIRQSGATVVATDIVIRHSGYETVESLRRKADRNLPLVRLQARETPDDPYNLMYLGEVLFYLGRGEEAVAVLARSLDLLPPDAKARSKVRGLLDALGSAHG